MGECNILLVEDNPADARLAVEAFRETNVTCGVDIVDDGIKAMQYLRREAPYQASPRPDLILLDLNLPRMNGREVLAELKADVHLQQIPVVVLTTSAAAKDVENAYSLHANCYITKPANFDDFVDVIGTIKKFWFHAARLPAHN